MQTSAPVRARAPFRLISAALFRPFGISACSFCRKRIVGLPYPQQDTGLTFCNSNCFTGHRQISERKRA